MSKDNRQYVIIHVLEDGQINITKQPKKPELHQLQALVNGYIETIPYLTSFTINGITYSRGVAYCNENGIMEGKRPNEVMTSAWQLRYPHAQLLLGPCVFYAKEPKAKEPKVKGTEQ